MPDDSTACILGRLQADTANMKDLLQRMDDRAEHDLRDMRSTLHKLDTRLRALEDTILTARVSWRTVIFVGGVISTIFGAVWGLAHYFYDPLMKIAKSIFGW